MADAPKRDVPWLTIVGGQPRRQRPARGTMRVPVGLEQLLYLAAGDAGLKERLLADPVAAAAEKGVRLRPSERAMLEVTPRATLGAMVDRIVPANPRRRKFMGLVATAAASLAAGTAGCRFDSDEDPPVDTCCYTGVDADHGSCWAGGITPDYDIDADAPMVRDGEADTEWDAESRSDAEVDAQVDAEIDAEADTDGESDVEADVEADIDVED